MDEFALEVWERGCWPSPDHRPGHVIGLQVVTRGCSKAIGFASSYSVSYDTICNSPQISKHAYQK